MKSQHVVRTHRPSLGLVAFAHAAAVKPQEMCAGNPSSFASISRGYRQLDRAEDQVHPGEGGA